MPEGKSPNMLQISISHVLNSDLTQLHLIVAEELPKLIQAFLRRYAVDFLTVQVCKAVIVYYLSASSRVQKF